MARVVSMDPIYNWGSQKYGPHTVHSIGREKTVQEFLGLLPESGPLDREALKHGLVGLKGNFAAVVEAQDFTLAVVDKVRGYPVFYAGKGKNFRVSNSARLLKEGLDLTEADELSLLEFRMAGYVTGRETLYKDLYQLQAGELLVWNKLQAKLSRERYYVFYSTEKREENQEVLIQELEEATNSIFRRVVDDAAGRPVWVPLSAGFDSRLVLCKLKQLKYDNLQTFSYGPPGNYDAKWAKYVANKLGIKWNFIPYKHKSIRKFFWSKLRSDYWKFSANLSSLPFMVDEYALNYLKENKFLQENSVIINGQSGDFISGGHTYGYHFPYLESQKKYNSSIIIDAILKKHYSLHKLLYDQVRDKFIDKITSLLELKTTEFDRNYLMSKYEHWEWQERQCKYVINGQRSYEYFGYKWQIPLWDTEYLLFWQKIKYEHKKGQYLYKKYLELYDFYLLFKNFKPKTWNWQRASLVTLPVGKIIKTLLGQKASSNFYKVCSYWGKYSNHYAPFGFINHFKKRHVYNGPTAKYAELLIDENI